MLFSDGHQAALLAADGYFWSALAAMS